jgi:hypothetical protein
MTPTKSRQALRNMGLIPPLLLSGSRIGGVEYQFCSIPPAKSSLPPASSSTDYLQEVEQNKYDYSG